MGKRWRFVGNKIILWKIKFNKKYLKIKMIIMLRKKILFLVFALIVFLSGCTLPVLGTITKIVYQEDKKINNLQEFLTEAQAVANKKIGSGAKAKVISYAYLNNTFSYEVTFAKDGEYLKDNILKNIVVSYNEDWKVKKQGSFSGHESERVVNNKLIAVECNRTIMCSTGTANSLADPKNNIDLDSIVFDLNNLINDKYLTGNDFGFIRMVNGVPIGNFSRFRFNATTVDGDIMDSMTADKSSWYKKNTGSDLNSLNSTEETSQISTSTTTATVTPDLTNTIKLNFDKDSDNDGLTDLQEFAYGTNPKNSDSDGDGHVDNDEINNGYNPLGSGKLISDNCSKNLTTDKCYLEMAVAKKDISFCQKNSTNSEIIQCLFKINLITKNRQVCEDLSKTKEGSADDFYNLCLKGLSAIVDPKTTKIDRDARTVGDIKQIQTALELYYNDNNGYPSSLEILTTGDRRQMSSLPIAIQGESSICAKDYNYKYTFISRDKYSLTYCIDGLTDTAKNIGITSGVNTASQNGIK